MEKQHWDKFYQHSFVNHPSKFAQLILKNYIKKGQLVDLGCGNGRDLYFFLKNGVEALGVDASMESVYIKKSDVEQYIKKNASPDYVYTRFFWHAIERPLQLKILKWAKDYIFIEARTVKDIPIVYPGHKRNLVDVSEVVNDLKENGFEIVRLEEGRGFSPYHFNKDRKEDPHLVRIIAKKI